MAEIVDLVLNFFKLYLLENNNYYFSILIVFLFLTFYQMIGLPGHVFIMLAVGYFFGTFIGYLLCQSSLVIGSFLCFVFGQSVLATFSPRTLDKYKNKIYHQISGNVFEYVLIFRLFPGTPLLLQNLVLSFLNIRKRTFLIATFLGFTPGTYITVYFGDQINNFTNISIIKIQDIFSIEFYLSIFFVISIILIKIIYKKNY